MGVTPGGPTLVDPVERRRPRPQRRLLLLATSRTGVPRAPWPSGRRGLTPFPVCALMSFRSVGGPTRQRSASHQALTREFLPTNPRTAEDTARETCNVQGRAGQFGIPCSSRSLVDNPTQRSPSRLRSPGQIEPECSLAQTSARRTSISSSISSFDPRMRRSREQGTGPYGPIGRSTFSRCGSSVPRRQTARGSTTCLSSDTTSALEMMKPRRAIIAIGMGHVEHPAIRSPRLADPRCPFPGTPTL